MAIVRICDIAREAGVSAATVTRYLNQSGYVSQEKGREIEKAVKKLRYVPNRAAQALKAKKSGLIGHIVPTTYHNPYFALLCEEVNRAAQERGCHVLTMVIDDAAKDLIPLVEQLLSRMADGILLSSFMQTEISGEVVEYLHGLETPLVMVERSAECFGIDKVLIHNAEGTYLAVRHLQSMGHTDIAYIGKQPAYSVEKERLSGFLLGVGLHTVTEMPEDRLFLADEYDVVLGCLMAKRMLQGGRMPTAVVIASDILAAGAVSCFLANGVRIPEDLSVVGHDDTIARYLAPPLTTVSLPLAEMAQSALSLILDQPGMEETGKSITLSPYLVERNSVRSV